MSKDKKLFEIWQDVKNSSKTQNEFKKKFVHELTQKSNDITVDEYINNFKIATDERYKYNHSFLNYFLSYANFVVFQLDSIEEQENPDFLIPLVYLVHHTVELFVKFIKLEATDLLQKKDTVIDLLTPINTSDIALNVHNIIDVLDEYVCVNWFNYLPNGDDIRQGIIRKYKRLCKIMKTDNLAEDTRFPTKRKSYGYNDFNWLEIDYVPLIINIVRDILTLCLISIYSWTNMDEETTNKLVSDIMKIVNGAEFNFDCFNN